MTNEDHKEIVESTLKMFTNPSPTKVTRNKNGISEVLNRIGIQTDQWLAREAHIKKRTF